MKIKDKYIRIILRFIEENGPLALRGIKLEHIGFSELTKYVAYLSNERFIRGLNVSDTSGFDLLNISLTQKGREYLKETTFRHKVWVIIVTIFSIGGVALLEYMFDFISFIIKSL